MPLNTTPPTWTFELKGCGNVACDTGTRPGMYVSASNTWLTPIVRIKRRTGDLLRRRTGAMTKRSTSRPVAIPTTMHTTKESHQFQPQSLTTFRSNRADSTPS